MFLSCKLSLSFYIPCPSSHSCLPLCPSVLHSVSLSSSLSLPFCLSICPHPCPHPSLSLSGLSFFSPLSLCPAPSPTDFQFLLYASFSSLCSSVLLPNPLLPFSTSVLQPITIFHFFIFILMCILPFSLCPSFSLSICLAFSFLLTLLLSVPVLFPVNTFFPPSLCSAVSLLTPMTFFPSFFFCCLSCCLSPFFFLHPSVLLPTHLAHLIPIFCSPLVFFPALCPTLFLSVPLSSLFLFSYSTSIPFCHSSCFPVPDFSLYTCVPLPVPLCFYPIVLLPISLCLFILLSSSLSMGFFLLVFFFLSLSVLLLPVPHFPCICLSCTLSLSFFALGWCVVPKTGFCQPVFKNARL